MNQSDEKYPYSVEMFTRFVIECVDRARGEDIYELIGENLLELNPGAIVISVVVELEKNIIHLKKITGLEPFTDKVSAILNCNPQELKLTTEGLNVDGLQTRKLLKVEGGLYKLSMHQIPKKACTAIEKLLNIREIFEIGYAWEGVLFGGAVIILRDNVALTKQEILEAYITQASIALKQFQTDEALRENQKEYQDLFDNAPDMHFLVQPDGSIKSVNLFGATYLGYTKEELIGKEVWHVVHPDDLEKVKSQIAEILASRKDSSELEFRKVRKDGSVLIVQERVHLILDENKNPVEIRIICRDITDNKKYEKDLIDRESQIRTILKYSPVPQIIENFEEAKTYVEGLKQQGITGIKEYLKQHTDKLTECRDKVKIIEVNNAFLKLYQAENIKILEQNVHRIITLQSIEMFVEGLLHLMDGEDSFTGETVYYDLENSKIEAITRWAVVPGHEDTLDMIVVSMEDMTELKKNEKDLLEAKIKAEESDKLKTAFLANMSHEIRTPMNAIVGFAELLKDPNLPIDQRLEFSNILTSSCETLSEIIDDIIDIAKIEAGQTKIRYSNCLVDEVMQELYTFYSKEIRREEKKIELRLKSSHRMVMVTDRARLMQILSNLLDNAVKFTDEGIVEFGCRSLEDESVEFFVADSGIGIPEEMHDLIFDRFRQLDNSTSRKHGGTGLGLTISKNLVDLLGGKIWLESVTGKGTTFFFRLPDKSEKEKPTESSPYLKIVREALKWNEKTVLIVEDNHANWEFFKAVLAKTGASLVRASTGQEALDYAISNDPLDLILMDIQMPDINGYEATKKIRQLHKNLPIIAQTAYAMPHDRERSLTAGCDDYLPKPIKPEDLLSIIKKYF